ncbi:alkaline phosphatase family protein [Paraburkholderia sp.]|uniref:alkaline phosphatase family protein n=1 Tax=Paraburkholderia sp. TaxID=1926495 RepID=UPI003D6F5C33
MFQISVVNRSSSIAEREMHRVVRAINRQIAEDFEPYWAFGGRLRVDGPAGPSASLNQLAELRGDALLYVVDSATSSDALGYHTRNLAGIPYGFVYLDLCRALGDEWSTTLSHEALELIGDPQCNLLVQGPNPETPSRTVYHYFEMCDAVQGQSYEIDGVSVSNFVLPQYFAVGTDSSARNDFCGTTLPSFGVNPGGYIGYFDPASDCSRQFFGLDRTALRRFDLKAATHSGRVYRRSHPGNGSVRDASSGPPGPGLAAAAPGAVQGAAQAALSNTPQPVADPVRHVVVLMLENRSFDHMLGALRASFNTDINGVDSDHPGTNADAAFNRTVAQQPIAQPFVRTNFNVPHEFVDVREQISDRMGHFIDAYRNANPGSPETDGDQVMAYFKDGDLPVLHTLAKNFLICDAWFSSLPGPTWPNRLFVHSGTSLGDVLMPNGLTPGAVEAFVGRYTQPTLYDSLDRAGVSWKIYHDSIPQSIVLDQLKPRFFGSGYQSMSDFYTACDGDEKDFPSYAFIEPRYFAGIFGVENDQHSPVGVPAGEQLIADVYNRIRANDDLWKSTLLVVAYDEHGGFYDHVTPPPTIAPDDHTDPAMPFGFDQLGVRVPAILVSPWVKQGVDHTVYDHTSILRYACEKWGLPYLCRRIQPAPGVNAIASFAHALSLAEPRDDTPVSVGQVAGTQQAAPAMAAMIGTAPGDTSAAPAHAADAADAQESFHGAQAALVAYAELLMKNAAEPAEGAAYGFTPDARASSVSGMSGMSDGVGNGANDMNDAADLPNRAQAVERWMMRSQQLAQQSAPAPKAPTPAPGKRPRRTVRE